ncbi:aspartic proteinase-like protein 2-like, partial [Trifolium medium]|nr:aspartic proteinase-like protein 2-like [Trifolium medium]
MAAVPVIIFMFTATMILTTAAAPLTLMLERAFPNHGIHLDELRARDTLRHGRLLKYSEHVVGLDVY